MRADRGEQDGRHARVHLGALGRVGSGRVGLGWVGLGWQILMKYAGSPLHVGASHAEAGLAATVSTTTSASFLRERLNVGNTLYDEAQARAKSLLKTAVPILAPGEGGVLVCCLP